MIKLLTPMIEDFDGKIKDIQRHRSICDDKQCVFHPDNSLFDNLKNVKPADIQYLHFSKYILSEI